MGSAIGDILPLAVGIAISPLPILAAILILFSPRARSSGLGFVAGRALGLILVVTTFTVVAAALPESEADAHRPIIGTANVLLGLFMLWSAVRQWRGRPREGAPAVTPDWMSAMDRTNPVRSFSLGLLLSVPNPKHILFGISAGLAIGAAGLSFGGATVAILVYTVVGVSSVAALVIAYIVRREQVGGPLLVAKGWLVEHNATIMTVMFLALGSVLLGKGIAAF